LCASRAASSISGAGGWDVLSPELELLLCVGAGFAVGAGGGGETGWLRQPNASRPRNINAMENELPLSIDPSLGWGIVGVSIYPNGGDSTSGGYTPEVLARLRLIVAAMCVLLCLATLILWVRSYFFSDTYIRTFGRRLVAASSKYAVVDFQTTVISARGPRPTTSWKSNALVNGYWRGSHQVFKSLYDFNWGPSQMYRWGGLGVPLNGSEGSAPLWSILVLEAAFPAWIFFRGHKEKRWTLGSKGSVIPALRWRVGRFAIFSAMGTVLGILFGWIGYPSRQLWRTQIAPELFALSGIAVILIILTRRRVRWHEALLWMALELAGFMCFFESVLDQMDHFFRHQYLRAEMVDQVLGAGAISFVCGATLLLLLRLRLQKRIPGPYCPQCGYCLNGLRTRRCTECGRPFTLEELGIDATALNPAGAPQDGSIPV
jgi:hypothetical protein